MISGAIGPDDHEGGGSSIYIVSILSGGVRKVASEGFHAKLSPDETTIVATQPLGNRGNIVLADVTGENVRPFIDAKPGEFHWSPTFSRDGERVVYKKQVVDDNLVYWESRGLDGEPPVVLMTEEVEWDRNRLEEFFAEDYLMLEERLVFARDEPAPRRDRNLWELSIDPGSGKPRGEPKRLTDWVGLQIRGLSATADESRLVFRDDHHQSDVWVGQVKDGGRSLGNVRRWTLDDRDDSPRSWTTDGHAIVFESDRYGSPDFFVQDLDGKTARDLVVAPGSQNAGSLSPDGAFFYYADVDESLAFHLRRVPIGGGKKELLEELAGPGTLHCPTRVGVPCVLVETNAEKKLVTWSYWDPESGKGDELWREERDPTDTTVRTERISPDGTRLASVAGTAILVKEIPSGRATEIPVQGIRGTVVSLAWAPDGEGFYVTTWFLPAELLYVDMAGRAYPLLSNPEIIGILLPVPSPDGRYLAFEQSTRNSNIWLVEDF